MVSTEQKETEKLELNGMEDVEVEEDQQEDSKSSLNGQKKKKKKQKKGKGKEEIISEIRNSPDKDSDSEEAEFWVPPVGERWDFDDGGDRWGSDEEPGEESQEEIGADDADGDCGEESEELSKRTKRMSIEIGPSSFAPQKKKNKKNPA